MGAIERFLKDYAVNGTSRFHMPGHKGQADMLDITEIKGADSLYEASGIIAESEARAAELFGTQATFYSTEGSSQCIKAMLLMAMQLYPKRKTVIAARNAHKAFLYGAALLDLNIEWLYPQEQYSVCACNVGADEVEKAINASPDLPLAVYLTSPDYLGNEQNVEAAAKVCREYGVLLLVDNAHGAYLHFLKEARHPVDLGASMCCDSAHKTLGALTGAAYLHVSREAPRRLVSFAKEALSLFGSTSPSYLILNSLDTVNDALSVDYREKLKTCVNRIERLKRNCTEKGWRFLPSDELKITVSAPGLGVSLAEKLRERGIECEYADPDFTVLMATPYNSEEDFLKLESAFSALVPPDGSSQTFVLPRAVQALSVREAILFAERARIPALESAGRILALPCVSCPPAVPIVMSGEVISPEAVRLFSKYAVEEIEVVAENNS